MKGKRRPAGGPVTGQRAVTLGQVRTGRLEPGRLGTGLPLEDGDGRLQLSGGGGELRLSQQRPFRAWLG